MTHSQHVLCLYFILNHSEHKDIKQTFHATFLVLTAKLANKRSPSDVMEFSYFLGEYVC